MKVLKWLDENIEKCVLVLLLVAITIVMFAHVVMRYAFKSGIDGAEEFSQYCFVVSMMFSIGYCNKKRSALRIDAIVGNVPKAVRRVMLIISDAVCVVFSAYFCYASIGKIQATAASAQTSTALGIPTYILYAIFCFCFALATIRSIQSIVMYIREKKGAE